jgi:hypothetical protein
MFGEGEIRVDMKNMRKICIENGAATITSRNAEQIRLTIDESLLLSGHTAFGGYSAPLSKIASIYLVLPGEKNSETLRAAGGEHLRHYLAEADRKRVKPIFHTFSQLLPIGPFSAQLLLELISFLTILYRLV